MTTEPKRPIRRLQFTLRKMLLWTAVVALWLGLVASLEVSTTHALVLSAWAAFVGIARFESGPRLAVFMSLVAALWVLVFYYFSFDDILSSMIVLVAIGLLVFAFVEVSFRLVNWSDHRMETKKDEEESS
jgi:hypothetical protein